MRNAAILLIAVTLVMTIGGPVRAESSSEIFRYLSPRPGARFVMPQSTLIFRPGTGLDRYGPAWNSSMEVSGSVSGVHEGRWITADDSRTVIFRPHRRFETGETVVVTFDLETAGEKMVYTHSFEIASRIVDYRSDPFEQMGTGTDDLSIEMNGRNSLPLQTKGKKSGDLPDMYVLPPDFPRVEITVCDDPADGKLFLANLPDTDDPSPVHYMMILENDGFPVFFRKSPGNVFDFKKQRNGLLSYLVTKPGVNHFFTMDNTYTVVDSYTTQDGYEIDMHDFQIMPNGHVLMIANDPQIVDMSQIVAGGDTAALVVGNVIQELDNSKNLVFQWFTSDFFNITDANVDLTRKRIRYAHINAIEIDYDGNIMISSRHQSEVTKIDLDTGQIIWRMGGNNNEFTLEGDTQWFSRQHDIRRLANGNVTVYDNGNLNDPIESRVVEYALDETNMIATRVWEYRNDPPIYASAMGSSRRLSGGNTLIGWGRSPAADVTEVRPDGTIALELTFLNNMNTYRAFRYPWEGIAAEPYAWADTTGGELWLHFTKFGDRDVAGYYVYRGTSPAPDWKAYMTCGQGVRIRDFTAGEPLYFRVTAVDRCGSESPFSNEVVVIPEFSDVPVVTEAAVKVTPSTLNLLSEGRWVTAQIEFPGECGHHVSDIDRTCILFNDTILVDRTGGNGNVEKSAKKKLMVKFPRDEVAAILETGDCVLVKVSGYVGEFAFEAFDHMKVIQSDSSCADSSDTDDGMDSGDDIADKDCDDGTGRKKERGERPCEEGVASFRNYPNPFNPVTVISFALPASTHVNLSVYDVNGRLVSTLADNMMTDGVHEIAWDGRGSNGEQVASGIYFYKLKTDMEVLTRKMVLLR
jgi:hypothetical protein